MARPSPSIDAAALDHLLWECCLAASRVAPTEVGREPLEELNQKLAQLVGTLIGEPPGKKERRIGFALLMFTMGEGGWMTWASNADRSDMVASLKEMTAKLERGEDTN